MPDVSRSSVLFSTEHGAARWTEEARVQLELGENQWVLRPEAVAPLHEAIEPLAAQVYRCDCDCRWQVRMSEQETAVLETDDVLRLHSLLDGTVAMLELQSMLDSASISRSSSSNREA